MVGAKLLGEKRTQDTQPVWPSPPPRSPPMVYLHSPRVFQSLMVRSRDAETICRLSMEKATERTSFSWPTKRRVVTPVERSQRRSSPSQDPESANWPSELRTTSWTKWPWPVRRRKGTPYSELESWVAWMGLVRSQTSSDLSREEETMKGELSMGVAMAVTTSLWPRITPAYTRDSCAPAMVVGRSER
uniref:Uncharacterized protein n=1 Tax=Triticum urartu TaxID=4572 RepID=A0A8R7TZM0_TRIUA